MREMLSVALSVFPDKSAIKQTFASQQRLGLNQQHLSVNKRLLVLHNVT